METIKIIQPSSSYSAAKSMLIKLCNKCMLQQAGGCSEEEMQIVCDICDAKHLIGVIQ